MITFIAFVLTILSCVNWLMIGLLQYDYIAGFFGFQASMFSRIIYIIFGVASAYLVIRVIINKGNLKVWEKKKAQQEQASENQMQSSAQMQTANVNAESAEEQVPTNFQSNAQNENQKRKGKKKWWQFWKRSDKKKKQKDSQEYPSDGQARHLPSQREASAPVDIDISLNTNSKHFNEQPSIQQQPQQDNLFDEHFER